jgi:ATP-dependent helicase/nuclease subunit B
VSGRATILAGRAGTGKTRRLLDRIAALVFEGREEAGLLLVPTFSQASHVKRSLLSRASGLPGFFDLSVFTFTSLAERLLTGRTIGDLLSGLRQDLLLRRAIRAAGEPFGESGRFAGMRRATLAFIKELKQNGLPPPELLEEVARLVERLAGAPKRRLDALRRVLAEYERLRVEERLLDHEDFLREARDRLRADPATPPLEFLGVDGFQNFTRLEREILLLLRGRAGETVVTLSLDPAGEGGAAFRVSEETRDFLLAHGFRIERLAGCRRTAARDLRRIEASLFSPDPVPGPPDGSVRVLMGADAEDEADRVARTAFALTAREGRRCRDIVVVVRDVHPVAERFRLAFARHGVPFRVSGGADLGREPLVRDAFALLAAAAGTPDVRALLALLRSGRVPGTTREEVDRIAEGIEASGPPSSVEGFVELVPALGPLIVAGLAGGPRPPADLAAGATELLRLLLRPACVLDPEGDEETIRREARALDALLAAIVATADSLGREGAEVGTVRFLDELREGLGFVSGPPPDRRLDVVDMIDAREARQWEAPVVFVCGLVEGEFPRRPKEDVFLPDRERGEVNRRCAVSMRERLLERDEERYLLYVALTRASERLFLTWPAADTKGEETLPSLFLADLLRLFPDDAVLSRRRLSDVLPEPDEVTGPEDLRRMSLLALADPFRPDTPGEEGALQGAALHGILRPDEEYRRALRIGLRFRRPPAAVLSGGLPAGERSVSSLEAFVQCPFLHFARYALRLAPPPAAAGLDSRLLGEIAHEVLASVFRPVVEGGEVGEPGPAYDAIFAARTAGLVPGLGDRVAHERQRAALAAFVERERERLRSAGSRPVLVEWGFQGLVVQGPEGRRVRLRGRIDRVDDGPGGAIVVDYKWSSRGFERVRPEDLEEGAHLQLPVYLLALREIGGREPRGAFLVTLPAGEWSGLGAVAGPDRTVREFHEEGLPGLLARTEELVLDLDGRIRAGEIAVRPRDTDHCRRCDFRDVCRVEPWLLAPGGE